MKIIITIFHLVVGCHILYGANLPTISLVVIGFTNLWGLILILMLIGLALSTGIFLLKRKKQISSDELAALHSARTVGVNSRRKLLKDMTLLPILGLFGCGTARNAKLYGADALPGATIQVNRDLNELKGELPKGKLEKHGHSKMALTSSAWGCSIFS